MINSPTWKSLAQSVVSVIAGALVLLAMWKGVNWYFELPPILLPSPSQVFSTAVEERQSLFRGTYVTGLAATVGLFSAVVIGCVISIAFSQSRSIRKAFFPYVVFLQTVPIVAIAPLLITWSGYQFRTVVIVTVIVCLFPIVNSVTEGLLAIQTDLNDMFRLYGASRTQRLLKLQLPTAIPYLMLGMKTSSGLAVIGAIVAEFFVGNGSNYDGLGTLMTGWQGFQRTDALIAAIFASTVLGLLLFAVVNLLAATVFHRWTSTDRKR